MASLRQKLTSAFLSRAGTHQKRNLVMLENEGVALRSIRWSEIFPWISIGKSFRLAVTLRLMTLGAAAVLLTLVGWWQIACLFSHEEAADVAGEKQSIPNRSWSGTFPQQSAWQVIDHAVPNHPFTGLTSSLTDPANRGAMATNEALDPNSRGGPMFATWALLSRPVWRILSLGSPLPREPVKFTDFLSLLVSALWSLAVWAYFGAAISRVAAVQLATGEQVGWGAAVRWAGAKWLAYISAAVLPMLAVVLVAFPIIVFGLLMRNVDFFAFVAGLIWPLMLFGGFVMTLLLIGVLLGWPLMWATISVEGTDSFDALNRTYSYVFQKPARYFFYCLIAAVIGWLGWIVVVNFAASVIWLASWGASWGAGAERMKDLVAGGSDSSLARGAASLIAFWAGFVKLLAIGYSFSYFGVASTAVYYLLRRDVDARESDEVFLDADASEQRFGLPTLQRDAAGAPEVAEKAPVGPSPENGHVDVE
jgi:hypothetical protein